MKRERRRQSSRFHTQRAQTHNCPETQDGEDDLHVNDGWDVHESDQREQQLRRYAKVTHRLTRPREHLAHDGFLFRNSRRVEVKRIDGIYGIVHSRFMCVSILFFIHLIRR